MRVLVTGGRGFIGRHVVLEAQRRGHQVEILRHDLRDPVGLANHLRHTDAIVHCAAAMTGSLDEQRAVTVDGTRHLLAAMREASVGAIVSLSTFAVYDYAAIPAGALLDETSPIVDDLAETGPYAHVKLQQERMVRDQAIEQGWRWTVLRPGIVYGPDRLWFHHLGIQLSGSFWIGLAGRSLLPLTYVENCAAAIVDALERDDANAAILNVVDDDPPARGDYFRALSARVAAAPKVVDVAWSPLWATARGATFTSKALSGGRLPLPDLLRTARLAARCKPLRYANARARGALAWTPRWTLAEALDRTLGPRRDVRGADL